MSDLKLAIILGSTRPGRNGEAVANWVLAKAKERANADYELIDLRQQLSFSLLTDFENRHRTGRRWGRHTPIPGPRAACHDVRATCSDP
ncbi:NADPH-dependent FMN reductase, partial [Streptomyces asiaticus]